MVLLIAVVLLLTAALHWYLWKRLVKDTTRTRRGRRVGTAIAALLALLIPATLVASRTLPHSRQALIAWPGFLWLALMFYLLVTLLILEIPRLALRLWLRRSAPAGERPSTTDGRSTGALVPEQRTTAAPAGLPAVALSGDLGRAGTGHHRNPTAAPSGELGPAVTGDDRNSTAAPGRAPDSALGDSRSSALGREPDSTAALAVRSPHNRNVGFFVHEATGEPGSSAVDGFDAGRRLLLGRSLAITAGVLSVGAVGIGMGQALGAPDLKRVPIRLTKLPTSMAGFRIALVSDIHLGPLLGRAHTERIVRMINSVDADLVAVVGDLVDGSVAELGPAAEPLQDLRAKHGSFFVTGNHEYFSGYQAWIDEVTSLGLRVLRNERVDVEGLDLAGVNDATGAGVGDAPDYAKALDGRDTARPVVLLAHQPVQAHEAARHGVDLQLSGHTHGGQMVPFNLLVGVQQPVVAGLGRVGGTQVYVTRGAGFWGPPVRFGAPPDISVVELHGA